MHKLNTVLFERRWHLLAVLLLSLSFLFIANSAEAQSTRGGTLRTVCPSGCDHTTIAAAVTASASGDIVSVNVNGTHTEPGPTIEIDKHIVLEGLGRQQTRIVMDSPMRHFVVFSGRLTVIDLTLADGNAIGSFLGGGSIVLNEGATLWVRDAGFENNSADYGGAITAFDNSTVDIEDSYFAHNTGIDFAGAIHTLGSLDVDNTTFAMNSSDGTFLEPGGPGGAIRAFEASLRLNNNTFYQNYATEGSAIYSVDSTLIMYHNTLHQTLLARGGTPAALLHIDGGVQSTENNIISNVIGPACSLVGGGSLLDVNMATDNTCGSIDHVVSDVRFGEIGYHSSRVPVLPLTFFSTARNKGGNAGCNLVGERDQRRAARRHDNGTCDLGAYEFFVESVCEFPAAALADNGAPTVETVDLVKNGLVLDVTVYLESTHPRVGDLKATVASQGQSVTLLDRPGHPASAQGCTRSNVGAYFLDNGTGKAEFACGAGFYAIDGQLNPATPMSTFRGLESDSTWSVSLQDLASGEVGTFDNVCVDVEYIPQTLATIPPLAVSLRQANSARSSVDDVALAAALVLGLVTAGLCFGRKQI